MLLKLILFRNELKIKSIETYKIIGIVAEIIFSKEIFNKNGEIKIFLKDVFNLTYKDYIMKSRTMIVSKISKFIITSPNNNESIKNLYKFINDQITYFKSKENYKEKNNFDGWIK